MMRLKDKVALVTGAGAGIGQAVADLFAREGATVFAGDLASAQDSCVAGAVALPLDVTSEPGWQRVVDTVIERCGRLDVLVNAAGTLACERLDELAADSWAAGIAMNQTGVFLGMREAVGVMRRQKSGAIVNIAPALRPVAAGWAHACHATTGAVRSMSKNAALACGMDGIRINTVLAGFVCWSQSDQNVSALGRRLVSPGLQRGVSPIEVAYGCLFLASDEASGVSGAELAIDGGHLAAVPTP